MGLMRTAHDTTRWLEYRRKANEIGYRMLMYSDPKVQKELEVELRNSSRSTPMSFDGRTPEDWIEITAAVIVVVCLAAMIIHRVWR